MPKAATTKDTKKQKSEPRTRAKAAGGKEKKQNKGKRPLSAYMFFSQDWRERIKAENPEAGFGELGKLLGAKWKEMDDEEKKPYQEQAAADKIRIEKERESTTKETKEKKEKKEASDAPSAAPSPVPSPAPAEEDDE